jgi:hypothetical protein
VQPFVEMSGQVADRPDESKAITDGLIPILCQPRSQTLAFVHK